MGTAERYTLKYAAGFLRQKMKNKMHISRKMKCTIDEMNRNRDEQKWNKHDNLYIIWIPVQYFFAFSDNLYAQYLITFFITE